jgi:hypothetical protein
LAIESRFKMFWSTCVCSHSRLSRRIVGVAHRLARGEATPLLGKLGRDSVIDLLLPIFMPRHAARIAIGIGVGQHLAKLAELVLEGNLGLLDALGCGRSGKQQGGEDGPESQGLPAVKSHSLSANTKATLTQTAIAGARVFVAAMAFRLGVFYSARR